VTQARLGNAATMFSAEADLFFCNPRSSLAPPGRFGILYLLRRDVDVCMGNDPNSGIRIEGASHSEALWPGAMAVMAGIDLLAKFYVGKDAYRGVGGRFRKFLEKYFGLNTETDRDVIYQLRNSLLHSFGLYSGDRQNNIYRFSLSQNGNLITPPANPSDVSGRYVVNLRTLHQQFENAVTGYKDSLEVGQERHQLQQSFNKMFPKYGAIDIGIYGATTVLPGYVQPSGSSTPEASQSFSSTFPQGH
jgi:hypothetical protein